MKLHELLTVARQVKGITLRKLEAETGINNSLLSQMESGHVTKPSFRNIVKLSRALNVSLETFANTIDQ